MASRLPAPGAARLHVALAALVLALVAAVFASPAAASPLSAKRAEAARVEAQVRAFDARLGKAVEEYDAARARLADVHRAIVHNRRRLEIARDNLAAARDNLAAALISSYKEGDVANAAIYVLGAESFDELMNRMDFVDRVSATQHELLDKVSSAEREVERRGRELRRDERRAEVLVRETAGRRDAIEADLRRRQSMLDAIEDDIAELIAAAERRRAARAAAAAAAAAEASASSGGATGTPTSVAIPPAGSLGQQAAAVAMSFLGTPYVYGGASPAGFDCSGLIMYSYAQVGVSLPHYTGALWNAGPHVSQSDLQVGDLVFFNGLGHAGIYVGGGSFVHAPHTGDVVKVSSLSESWYADTYMGAVRILG